MFGEKTYKLTQSQIDEINKRYDAVSARACKAEAEVAELKETLRLSKVSDYLDTIEVLQSTNTRLTKELTEARSTMSAVLSTLDESMKNTDTLRRANKLYRDMSDCNLPSVTHKELNILH